jgi:hypothetical protein
VNVLDTDRYFAKKKEAEQYASLLVIKEMLIKGQVDKNLYLK